MFASGGEFFGGCSMRVRNVSVAITISGAAILATTLLLGGCEKSANPGGTSASTARAALPADFFLSREPAEVRDVADVRSNAKAGEPVVVRGRIGGADPFGKDRAIFKMVDRSLKTCAEKP